MSCGKPHPEVFEKAADALSLNPANCVVIEDALLGIEAAKRAGCKAIAVTTTFEKEHFLERAYKPDAIFSDLSEVTFEFIDHLFSS